MTDAALRCPTCGAPVSEDQLRRFAGACSRCVLLFVAEETPPQFPNLQLQEVLGRGGMGVVYRAVQPRLNRTVALKVLTPKLTDEPGALERFTREATAMAKLQHPNIVTLHDFGIHGGVPFFVMEYVEGRSLRKLLQEGPLPPQRALEIAVTLCSTLDYAHRRGVVHRDLKPENVLLDAEGRVKLADFGLAQLGGTESTRLTGPHAAMGTPGYMAPEQVDRPQQVDLRADLYSLGILLYEMLTGNLPVGSFAPPSARSGVDARLDQVVLRLLDREPGRRFESAEVLKDALLRTGVPGRRRVRSLAAAIAGVLLLTGLIAVQLRTPPENAATAPRPAPAWTDIGGSASNGGVSASSTGATYPSLAVDASGNPAVAWVDGEGRAATIRVRRWTGAGWTELGSLATSAEPGSGPMSFPAIALDASLRPLLTWHGGPASTQKIFVKRWTGSEWSDLEPASRNPEINRSAGSAARPALAIDSAGNPVVVWYDRLSDNACRVRVSRWDGRSWGRLPDPGQSASLLSPMPTVAMDARDRIVLAWRVLSGTRVKIHAVRWDRTSWSAFPELAAELPPQQPADDRMMPFLALDGNGDPILAHGAHENMLAGVRVRRWREGTWEDVGGFITGTGVQDARQGVLPALATDASGTPVVAWSYILNDRRAIHCRRWTGKSWDDLGMRWAEGTSSPTGLHPVTPFRVALALDRSGDPFLAWVERDRDLWQIYLRRYRPASSR
jgi:hypothetical protein